MSSTPSHKERPLNDAGWTPGPWWASATREVFNASRRTVCRAHLDGEKCTREQALANARLIAAAPELAEELEKHIHAAAQWYESVGEDPDVKLKDADALLTRLLGRAPR